MPAIAKGALDHGVQFYWHLGDFRALFKIDEDLAHDPHYQAIKSLEEYRKIAWEDFIHHEIEPFGKTPVYLGIGNHETINRDRSEYISTFRDWLGPDHSTKIYYRWIQANVDFINLDNASDDQFDAEQMRWFHQVMKEDEANPAVTTIVVGMHKALPDSISFGHSMSESKNPISVASGREVYHELLKAKNESHKNIYILGSHSHFFMDGTFNTEYWKKNGGVLPGWIIGTAGAERYPLPTDSNRANQAKTHVYGYLLATVDPDQGNQVRFDFKQIEKSDIPAEVVQRYGTELVNFCFEHNASEKHIQFQ